MEKKKIMILQLVFEVGFLLLLVPVKQTSTVLAKENREKETDLSEADLSEAQSKSRGATFRVKVMMKVIVEAY